MGCSSVSTPITFHFFGSIIPVMCYLLFFSKINLKLHIVWILCLLLTWCTKEILLLKRSVIFLQICTSTMKMVMAMNQIISNGLNLTVSEIVSKNVKKS